MKPIKILALPVDRGGCGWYRIRQPFQAITEYSSSDAHVIDKDNDDPIEVLDALLAADILVVRQGGEIGIDMIEKSANEYATETKKPLFHAKIVLDIDDNIELISPYSQHYKEYGVREYKDKSGKWIWQKGKDGFDPMHNKKRVMDLMLGMRKVDMVTTTTEKLADYARQYNETVAVLPNVINTDVWWKPPFQENKQLRVGWSGGISHYEDWYTIREPLNKLLRKYQFKLILVGSAFTGLIDKDLQDFVEVHPWTTFEAHSYRMMLMNLDMAIIPLADLPFNHYKSPIKLLEMAAMGVPSIVADVIPYATSGITRKYPYKTADEFATLFEGLLQDGYMRLVTGNASRNEVEKQWTAKQHVKTYLNAYKSLLV